uniref:Prolyl 4-hydroxylase alpha subunit domain-containing protein n=1 Tax=Trichobilharzia regenti TaxID=157069 RepID=A0AA85IWK8_TRIRE|nr:unnamed protein product [Trichobilharzia regenti]
MVFQINREFVTEDFKRAFYQCYNRKIANKIFENGSLIDHEPFTFAKFDSFIQLEQITEEIINTGQLVHEVKKEIEKLPFVQKCNDLYTFSQSCDILNLCQDVENPNNSATCPLIISFRTFLLNTVLPWLKDITGIPLYENKVDLTSSIYKQGDYLLCHDDELEGRRIAFIWYLVPDDWNNQKDGGELELFDSVPVEGGEDNNNEGKLIPTRICVSLPPKCNTFTFFEVSPRSFHQVAEVLGNTKRVSLHGWFHGPSLWTVSNNTLQGIEKISPVYIEEELVYQWINPVYFDTQQLSKIRRKFYKSSEIQLINFLKADKWKELVQCLDNLSPNAWIHCGPANRRNYNCLSNEKLNDSTSDLCRQLIRLFKSEAMLVVLSDITGIRLHPCALIGEKNNNSTVVDNGDQAIDDTPETKRMRTDDNINNSPKADKSFGDQCSTYLTEPCLRKFQAGSYTLLSDADMLNQGWRVECILHIHGYSSSNCDDKVDNNQFTWNSTCGGQTIYVADGETEELLTVTPSDNALTLVYVDSSTTGFLKYIKKSSVGVGVDVGGGGCGGGRASLENQGVKQSRRHSNVPSTGDNHQHTVKKPVQFYDLFVKYFDSTTNEEDDDKMNSVNAEEEASDDEVTTSSSLNDDNDNSVDDDDESAVLSPDENHDDAGGDDENQERV